MRILAQLVPVLLPVRAELRTILFTTTRVFYTQYIVMLTVYHAIHSQLHKTKQYFLPQNYGFSECISMLSLPNAQILWLL